jgi:hypothetical protein
LPTDDPYCCDFVHGKIPRFSNQVVEATVETFSAAVGLEKHTYAPPDTSNNGSSISKYSYSSDLSAENGVLFLIATSKIIDTLP